MIYKTDCKRQNTSRGIGYALLYVQNTILNNVSNTKFPITYTYYIFIGSFDLFPIAFYFFLRAVYYSTFTYAADPYIIKMSLRMYICVKCYFYSTTSEVLTRTIIGIRYYLHTGCFTFIECRRGFRYILFTFFGYTFIIFYLL